MKNCQAQFISSAVAVTLLGGCAAFQPQAKLEIRSVETAMQAGPESDNLAEGRALLNLGQNANAVSAFRAALRETPNSGDAYNGLAIAYDRIGRQDLAQRYFELAVSADPENLRFRGNLARLFNRAGQPQLALGLLDQPVLSTETIVASNVATGQADVAAPHPETTFVAVLPAAEPVSPSAPVLIEPPALAMLEMSSPVQELAMAEPEPPQQAMTGGTIIHAVHRPSAAMIIRPAAIDATQLPKPRTPSLPETPSERFPADLPRQVAIAVQREGIRLERISLGEVRLVTRTTAPKMAGKSGNFDSFGVRLATWLPGAIAVEQAGRPVRITNSPTLQEAIARARIEKAIEETEIRQDEVTELAAFTYAFFHGDDVEEVALAAL